MALAKTIIKCKQNRSGRQISAAVQMANNILLRDWRVVPEEEFQISLEPTDVPEA